MISRLARFAIVSLLVTLNAAPVMAAAGCPSGMLFEPDASGALVDAGWTGIAHDMPAIGYTFRMGVSCGPSTPPCGTCTITGLVPNAGGNNQRCRNDTSLICTVATEVTDCGGAGLCTFWAGPPTPINTGGVTTCYTSEITGPVGGTVDVDTGSFSPDVPFRASLYNGITGDQPCPRCGGDPTANDNVRGGTCSGGARNGLSCDANATAFHTDFGSVSFDCPPNPGSNIANFVLGTLQYSTEPQSVTLTANSPNCWGNFPAGPKCGCDTCNNSGALTAIDTCFTNADCPASGGAPGVCGGRRCITGADDGLACRTCAGGSNDGGVCSLASACPGGSCIRPTCAGGAVCNRLGEPTKPNACNDDTALPANGALCVDVAPAGDGQGECQEGPIWGKCSASSGHAHRDCNMDEHCCDDAGFGCIADPPTPGECIFQFRPCFTDNGAIGGSIDVVGTSTPPVGNTSSPTDIVALPCIPPVGAPAVNIVGGFPGVARTFQPGQLIFAEEIVVQVVPPGGTVTTAGVGPASVVETSVTTPTGGEVQIVGTFNAGLPPSGYEFLGRLVQIEALPASASSPLRISFDIDASEVPPGQNENTIEIFRNGAGPIPDCLGATQAIPDDPCVTERIPLGGGDVRIAVLTSAASDWTMAAPSGAGPIGANKCVAAKDKCVAKKQACKLGCHAKAESKGVPVDPLCEQKCEDKFDGGPIPSKGCFAKLEAKYGPGCFTSGDTAALEATVDAFVLNAVTQVDPFYPAPVLNKCSAGKKKCIGKKASCKLGCYSKAHGKGVPVDPLCLGKCEDKFDGGATPSKGCFAKLETKPPCLTVGDVAALEATVDAFVGDVVCQLHGTSDGTCPCPIGTNVGGSCWLLGAVNESCATVCSNAGATVDTATTTYAGSGGTDTNCNDVLDAVGAGPGNFPFFVGSCSVANECIFAVSGPDSQRARCLDTPANYGASNPFHRRACACTP